tara:strand:- start:1292 stop:1552 length:261 start_codon:yes stop_codon:yes gene_type:complete
MVPWAASKYYVTRATYYISRVVHAKMSCVMGKTTTATVGSTKEDLSVKTNVEPVGASALNKRLSTAQLETLAKNDVTLKMTTATVT